MSETELKAYQMTLQTLNRMAQDVPGLLAALPTEQLEGVALATKGAVELLSGRESLDPAKQIIAHIRGIVQLEQGRRELAGSFEARELERVAALE